ncbi:PREDICTED: collagen alpha-1(I) chain-like [Capra hircus]|uniref:collagen alpha-1(I) chain-like n=1 Tax=Capra hircus TaxID=9925 RepID=UPI000847643C|nr:PREDICTED: collagen alpha-1(I) chain-like [Capra hircus]
MHGLIFETSICYWQDQRSRGKRARRRGAGRAGGGGGVGEADRREAREPREEGGPGRALAGRESRPPRPARGEDAGPRRHPRVREGRGASPPPREARGGGGVVRRGGGRRAALLSPPPPARPGHTGDGRRAPSASVRPPPRAGRGRRAARTRRPARGGARPGTRPALGRAHRGGGAPSSGTRRRRRRRRRHGRRIGAAAGPGSEAHRGTRPRGAADGEGTEADGRAERGTDGMRPRGADTAQPAAGVGWPRATARGTAQSEPGEGTRVGRRGPPRDLTATGPPGTGAVPRRHPRRRTGAPTLAGLAATATATPGAAAGPGRTLSRRTPAAPPPTALTRAGSPAPPPSLRAFRGHCTAPPGDATGPAGAGGRHPREGEARPARARAGDGNAGGRTRGTRRGEARPAAAGRGRRARTAGAAGQGRGRRPGTGGKRPGHAAGPPGTPARDPTATRTRGRSRDARGAGRPRPSPERGPRPGPAARAGEPSTRLPPSIRHRSVFRLSLNPEARQPGDDALERGGPDRDRTPPPAAAQGARAGATGSPSPTAAGPGKPRPTGRRAPTRPPLPPGLTPRGPAARTRPPTCRTPGGAQRDPPPTRRGEARAARRRSHRGRAVPPPDRLAFGLTEALHEPPGLSRAGGVCGTGKRTTTQERVRGQGQSRARVPPPARPHPPRPPRRGERARLSLPPRPPRKTATLGTHTPPWRGPEGDAGLRETTPPLGLRHLRDDLERSRGTTEGHTRHARTPAWGAQRGSGGTALPATGRAARRAHAEEAKRERPAVSEDQRPPLTPRGRGRETEDQGQRPHPTPAFLTLPDGQRGGEDKRGAPRTDREERTRSPGTPVPRPARFRLGPGEHDHTTSIRGAEVEQGEARRGQSPEGPAFSLAGSLHPPPPRLASPRLRRERPTTPREHLTGGAEPTGRGSSQPPPGAHSGGEGRRG